MSLPLRIDLLGELQPLRDGSVAALPASKKTRALLVLIIYGLARR